MNIIILGPPGSGKGTQAKLLSQKLSLNHISSGTLLRQAVKSQDPKSIALKKIIDKGELPPFNSFAHLVFDQITKSPKGFVLDGTPRNQSQAEYLNWYFNKNKIAINHVILLILSDKEAFQRLTKRAIKENRTDDTPQTIKNRLQVYQKETKPIIDYYRQQNNLTEIDGSPDIDTIHHNILAKLNIKD